VKKKKLRKIGKLMSHDQLMSMRNMTFYDNAIKKMSI